MRRPVVEALAMVAAQDSALRHGLGVATEGADRPVKNALASGTSSATMGGGTSCYPRASTGASWTTSARSLGGRRLEPLGRQRPRSKSSSRPRRRRAAAGKDAAAGASASRRGAPRCRAARGAGERPRASAPNACGIDGDAGEPAVGLAVGRLGHERDAGRSRESLAVEGVVGAALRDALGRGRAAGRGRRRRGGCSAGSCSRSSECW